MYIKTTLGISNIADDLSRFAIDGNQRWVSVESIKDLLNKDNLCYITKERLLKELEEK